MMPDVNTLYYVFSTISQTLAGIVGILAAFAVMRLSDLSKRLERELPAFASYCQYKEIFYVLLAEGDFDGAISQVPESGIEGSDDSLMLDVCREKERERKQLFSALRHSLLITGLVIGFSVANLIFAKQLAANGTLIWPRPCPRTR